MTNPLLTNPQAFSVALYEKMKQIQPGIANLEWYEFQYCLDNVTPKEGWQTITIEPERDVERMVNDVNYYSSIHLRPYQGNRMVMDEKIIRLLRMLFVGLVTGDYLPEWVNQHFSFDIRGFYFIHRTEYFTDKSRDHLGGKPFRKFEEKQKALETQMGISYKVFKEANAEVDDCFLEIIKKLTCLKGSPCVIAIAGQTAAGKTEITARLCEAFTQTGKKITSIEMDNFFTDRDYREARGIDSLGKEALHYELLQQCLKDICKGKKIITPRYDFIQATSSHTLDGRLREGCSPVEIEPADIIFMEGNFPFLLPEIAPLISIKVLYLTADDIRLKRKWKRDMDYRKKYDLMYFLNRYFREQYLMAEQAYIPQMEICDVLVDTTHAALWVTPEIAHVLEK